MTDASMVTCRRCGFANVPGDQFCGSCGAFLEWEGEAAGGVSVASSGTAGVPHDEGLSGLVRPATPPPVTPQGDPSTAPTAAWPTSGTGSAPVIAPTPPQGGGALLRCPACGIANAPGRTFCQSCGATLVAASRVAGRTPEEIAAAVAAVPRTSQVTGATTGAARARDQPKKGGIGGWVIAAVVLGILVGVGAVAASFVLRGQGPATGATSEPSIGAGPTASAQAPASGTPAVTTPPASTAPTPFVEGAPLFLTGAAASSTVGNLAKFQPGMAIDGSTKTCWQEGSATEKGEWIEVGFAASRVDAVILNNGYGASTPLYKGNLRLKDILISVNGGEAVKVRLKDTGKSQRIALGPVSGATKVRITIVSTYASVKTSTAGTPFDDAALSEIVVIGAPGG